MDWHQLRYFQILARICNFSKAAEELTLSQPALSRTISRLEEEIGVPLFERKSRGVILNRYGEVFLDHVNRALGEIDQAKKKIDHMVDPLHGTLSLGFIQPLGSSFIPELMSKFQKEAPGIQFHLTRDTSNQILNQLESAKVDVAFCTLQQPFKDFSTLHIMTPELFLIVDKDHRLANVEQIDLSELADDPFVLYKPQTALRDIVEKLCNNAGFQPKMSFEAFDERTVAGLVGAKFGVALIPLFPGIDLKKVSLIRVRNPRCSLSIHMFWRSQGYSSPALTRFKSFIKDIVSNTTP